MEVSARAGLVDVLDGYVHAVRPGVIRAAALCGAGAIVIDLTGPYDAADALACPRCTDRLLPVLELSDAPRDSDARSA